MKINRFKLNESVEEKYHIFTELIDDDFSNNFFVSPKLYDNENDAKNFLFNKLYNTYKDNDFDLDDLEENFNENSSIDELLSIYEQIITEELDKKMNLYYRTVALNIPKLDKWIEDRITLIQSKKFNI